MKNKTLTVIFSSVTLIVLFFYFSRNKNPFLDVVWIEGHPGANGRFTTFTPVLKKNPKIAIGPIVGADYGEIYFEDINKDGIKEVIIETNGWFHFEQYDSERHILEYRKTINGEPQFVLIKSEVFEN